MKKQCKRKQWDTSVNTLHHAMFQASKLTTAEWNEQMTPVITATEAGELLPRAFNDSTHFECRMCAWQDRCWRTQA